MSLQGFINSAVQQSTKCQKSPMEQSLLLPTSKTFTKIRNKKAVKVTVVAAIVIWDEYPNIKPRIDPERNGLFGKVSFYVWVVIIHYSFWFSIIGILVRANSLFKLPNLHQLDWGRLNHSKVTRTDYDYEESKRRTEIITRVL